MKNMKKTLLVSLSLVLIAALAIGMTLAYLTDTDDAVNVMTMGNVSIVQNEQQRVEANGEFTSELEDFEQGKAILPVTYPGNRTADTVKIGDYEIKLSDNEANYVDKIVSVTNTGKTDAFVRTLVAVPTGGADWEPTPVSANNCWLHWNLPTDYAAHWTLNTATFAEINGQGYYIWEFIHKEALSPKETSYPAFRGFYLDQKVDNDENGYYMTYADGTVKRIDDIAIGDTVDILVVSQAVQAAGFSNAQAALDKAFGDITSTNHPWADGKSVVNAANDAELDAAIQNGAKTVILSEGTYTLPTVSGDVTLIGAGKDVVIDCTTDAGSNSNTVKFVNVTIQGVNKDYTGMKQTGSVTYEDCLIKDSLTLYADDVVFSNCEFNLTGRYIWTYGADNVLFENCTFNNSDSRAILVYQETDSVVSNVTLKNCTFTAAAKGYTGAGDWTAAVEIDASLAPANVVAENCVVDGNYSGLIRVKAGNPTVSEDGNKKVDLMIATAEDMFNFAKDVNSNHNSYSGKTVMLTADIDLNNELWTPVGQTGATQFLGTFDGNGYTISNLNVDMSDKTDEFSSSGLFGWLNAGTVKNLTVDTATIKGNHNVGVIAGYMETAGCTISGCNVVKATIIATHANKDQCGDKVGVIVGHAGNSGVVVENCTAKDSTVTAGRDAGQIVGAAKTANVTGCTATNVTVSADGTCPDEAYITNDIIGRILY